MARRHNAKGRNKGDGQYMPLPYAMTKHNAWRGLSGSAIKVFIELRGRYFVRGDGTNNNGALTLSLDEAARLLGLGKATVLRALNELESAGFIHRTKRGRWYGRVASEYSVSDCPLGNQPPTRDWQTRGKDGRAKLLDSNGVIIKTGNGDP